MNPLQARAACNDLDARLPTPGSAKQNSDFWKSFVKLYKSRLEYFWLGFDNVENGVTWTNSYTDYKGK